MSEDPLFYYRGDPVLDKYEQLEFDYAEEQWRKIQNATS
jgi:hypothetical protein